MQKSHPNNRRNIWTAVLLSRSCVHVTGTDLTCDLTAWLIMASLPALSLLKGLLRRVLRITVLDGRIFIGTFVGTDQPLNVLLVNAEEFRIGEGENPNGRFVGQVMIPWKVVVKAEAQSSRRNNRNGYQQSTDIGYL